MVSLIKQNTKKEAVKENGQTEGIILRIMLMFHKKVNIYCNTKQFPELPYRGPHPKPHGNRGLSKYYHLRFDPKLGHVKCEIRHIPCACVACTLMLEKLWIYGIFSKKQAHKQPVTNCTYWPVLGSFNNLNII